MRKKLLSILLSLAMVITMLPMATMTAFAVEEKIGDSDTTWMLSAGETVLTIGGTGAMPNFAVSEEQPWKGARSTIETVIIQPGVTRIGNCAFEYCQAVTSVTIPSSVTSIGMNAFNCIEKDAPNATPIIDTLNIDSIESWCGISFYDQWSNPFRYPEGINLTLNVKGKTTTELIIPNTVTSIPNYAFHGWKNLTSVIIPSSVTSIGQNAFCNCHELKNITIPSSVTSIGESAFYGCSKLTSITIPSSVTSIENTTFGECTGLESVTIPSSVTSIGQNAFYNCNKLKNVTIPSSVTSIGEMAFFDCFALTRVTVKAMNCTGKLKLDTKMWDVVQ